MAVRIGFVTCVELGKACIDEVQDIGGEFAQFITLHDNLARNKSGRVFLDALAQRSGTPLLKIRHINDEDSVRAIRAANLDWLFIVGWSQIASSEILASVRCGVLGMHPTLLPQGRGRAAIPWAILKNLTRTGVTLFCLDEGVDSGPIVDQISTPIGEDDDASSLYLRLASLHRELIRRAWPKLISGNVVVTAQHEPDATLWPGRRPEDGLISSCMRVSDVHRLVRAVTRPYPGAYVEIGASIYTIWSGRPAADSTAKQEGLFVSCADGLYQALDYELREGQPDGGLPINLQRKDS